jgi:cytochrome c553
MKTFSRLIAVAALAVAPLVASAADVAAGQKIADAQCAACHGKDGKTPTDPSYPKLAGQYSDYLAVSLLAYQNGERKNAIMAGMAATAAWSALPSPVRAAAPQTPRENGMTRQPCPP